MYLWFNQIKNQSVPHGKLWKNHVIHTMLNWSLRNSNINITKNSILPQPPDNKRTTC